VLIVQEKQEAPEVLAVGETGLGLLQTQELLAQLTQVAAVAVMAAIARQMLLPAVPASSSSSTPYPYSL